MLSSIHRILRLASFKAVLIPLDSYEKMSRILTAAGWFEDFEYDVTSLGSPQGQVLLTEGMVLWTDNDQKPIPGILLQKELEGEFGRMKQVLSLYDAAKRFMKSNPTFKAGEKAAQAFLRTPAGKALID